MSAHVRAKKRAFGRRSRRGVTLLEAVLAVALLGIGIVGIAGLLGNVSAANRKGAFQNYALDVFTEMEAQIQNAACDVSPSAASTYTDPGLTAGGGVWVVAPVAGSGITMVGPLTITGAVGGANDTAVIASYQATLMPNLVNGCPVPCTQPDEYQITLQICDSSNPDLARPCGPPPVNGYWVRTFQLTKTCTIRLDDSGRGEFY
jgi:type II secretory pathway pseudopilin PulG